MSATRMNVDYKHTDYVSGNKTHREFIEGEIADFEPCFNELDNYDDRTKLVAVFMICAWLFGSISTGPALLLCLAYILASHEFFGRPEYARQHQVHLNKLYELYCWCIESDKSWSVVGSPKKITSDDTFLKLTETILSYVSTEDLKKPLKDWNRISEQFKQLLLQHPKHRNNVLKDIQASSGGIWSYFKSTDSDEIVKTAILEEENSKTLYGRARQVYAEAKYTIYCRSSKKQQTLIESGKQVVGPVLSLIKPKSP